MFILQESVGNHTSAEEMTMMATKKVEIYIRSEGHNGHHMTDREAREARESVERELEAERKFDIETRILRRRAEPLQTQMLKLSQELGQEIKIVDLPTSVPKLEEWITHAEILIQALSEVVTEKRKQEEAARRLQEQQEMEELREFWELQRKGEPLLEQLKRLIRCYAGSFRPALLAEMTTHARPSRVAFIPLEALRAWIPRAEELLTQFNREREEDRLAAERREAERTERLRAERLPMVVDVVRGLHQLLRHYPPYTLPSFREFIWEQDLLERAKDLREVGLLTEEQEHELEEARKIFSRHELLEQRASYGSDQENQWNREGFSSWFEGWCERHPPKPSKREQRWLEVWRRRCHGPFGRNRT